MSNKYKLASIIISIILLITISLFLWLRPNAPNFSQYEAGKARKNAFFSYLLPIIQQQNTEIRIKRKQLLKWQKYPSELGWWDKRSLSKIAEYYRLINFDYRNEKHWRQLLIRVNSVPASLALAQAANESAWGTSRFAVNGSNYFGQWCFEKGCGIVPTKRSDGKAHEVAAFDSPKASVVSYLHNLNSHPAYAELRELRLELVNNNKKVTGIALVNGLLNYSERGEQYIKELSNMIRFNKLEQYD